METTGLKMAREEGWKGTTAADAVRTSCELDAMISPILQTNRGPFLSSKGHPSGSPSLNCPENLQLPLL